MQIFGIIVLSFDEIKMKMYATTVLVQDLKNEPLFCVCARQAFLFWVILYVRQEGFVLIAYNFIWTPAISVEGLDYV